MKRYSLYVWLFLLISSVLIWILACHLSTIFLYQVPPPNVSLQPAAKWQSVGVNVGVGGLGPGPRMGPSGVGPAAASHLRGSAQPQALQYPQGPLQ